MSQPPHLLMPASPFAALPVAMTPGGGVSVLERDGLGIATLMVRRGRRAALTQCLRDRFGVELPQMPRRHVAERIAAAGTGRDTWLATLEGGGNRFAESLRSVVGDLASVTDQSDGYAMLRLMGPKVRDALCKLVPIDIHARAFSVGDVAVTAAGHIPVTLWRLEDRADAVTVFEIVLYRSLAADFWRALSAAAAEFGFDKLPS